MCMAWCKYCRQAALGLDREFQSVSLLALKGADDKRHACIKMYFLYKFVALSGSVCTLLDPIGVLTSIVRILKMHNI